MWIDYWFCDDVIKGTGRVLMKDFLTYLLNYSIKQPIYINKNTIIKAYAVASIAETYSHKKITKSNNQKLIHYYKAMGFTEKNEGGPTIVSGTIDNIIKTITNYIGGKKQNTKRRKTKRKRYTNRKK